jgi:plastocyanin
LSSRSNSIELEEEIVRIHVAFASVLLLTVLITPGTGLAGAPSQSIAIRGNGFVPAQLELPPGVKVKLVITNEGTLPAEFESFDLSREIIVPAGRSVTVFVGPLDAGRYEFFNDFNRAMQGSIIVKPVGGGRD